jgi:anaerobic selenocysteine-containing dehydrogenase
MASRVVRSSCRACHGGCGVLVGVENNKVTSIKGDPDCPVNRGWLCIKGKRYHTITHHPERLTDPLLKRNGTWKKISWDCLLYTSPSPRDRQKSRMPSSA